jgi:hypothetical protein
MTHIVLRPVDKILLFKPVNARAADESLGNLPSVEGVVLSAARVL